MQDVSVEGSVTTLGDAIVEQQARLRVMLAHGKEIGHAGHFYCVIIEETLRRADLAVMEQDLVRMIAILKAMQEMKE